jgi:glycine cleavage system H lipoate-binding protein
MIASGQGDHASERCSNASHVNCELYASKPQAEAGNGACPYLHDTLAHYCGAAPVARFIPFSDQAGRCGGSGFRFCELYLGFERAGDKLSAPRSGNIRVPADLYYAPNHLWLHVGPNGTCHIGIDAFFASVLHSVESVAFVTTGGVDRPSAVLNVHGVDWPISFQNRVLISGVHTYLRSTPERLMLDPYGAGWLFEACELPGEPAQTGLMTGRQALTWMEQERRRFDESIHAISGVQMGTGPAVMNDGGDAVVNVLGQFGREEILRMLHTFFAPDRSWGEETSR